MYPLSGQDRSGCEYRRSVARNVRLAHRQRLPWSRNSMKPTLLGLAIAALAIASPVSAQTMYRCQDLGKTIYTDKPCLNGDEVKQMSPNGNPTAEYVARVRMKMRADEQRAITAARVANRDAETGKVAKCVKGATSPSCEP
jgi:hypothetical protein